MAFPAALSLPDREGFSDWLRRGRSEKLFSG